MRVRLPFILLIAATAAAQSASLGTISGIVTDPQGAVVPGAVVTVRNADSNVVRTARSSDSGSFTVSSLPAGNYGVQATAVGFSAKKPLRLTLGVGAHLTLTLPLDIASASSSVTVTGRAATLEGNTVAPEVNTEEAQTASSIAGLTVTYLPNRDRDFSQFAELGAAVETDGSGGVIVAGQRTTAFAAAIDGVSFTDPLNGGLRGQGDRALFFPQTAVREFAVVRTGASAEIGETNAGFLNVATKSGGNKFHGEGFYIGRPATLTSKDAFGHSLESRQNEFGGSVGGPIVPERAFFYAGAEQDFLDVPHWTGFAPQAAGVSVPPALAAKQVQTVERNDPTAVFFRTDVNAGSANTVNLELDWNRARGDHIVADDFGGNSSTRTLAAPEHAIDLRGESVWARANLATVVTPTSVNQLWLQWSDDRREFTAESSAPEIVIIGFGELGGNAMFPDSYRSSRLAVADDVALDRGRSSLHIGATVAHDPLREWRIIDTNGRYDYDSLADYEALLPSRVQQTFAGSASPFRDSIEQLGFYASERWRATQQLTITAGLRWDGQWNPSLAPNDLAQWQPRFGVAWNPVKKMVVRASAGLYDAPTPGAIFARVAIESAPGVFTLDSYYDPSLLATVTGVAPYTLSPAAVQLANERSLRVDGDFRNPRSAQFSASVEQQLTKKLSGSAGFVRNSTWDLQRIANMNVVEMGKNPLGLPSFAAADPAAGQILVNRSDVHSAYDAMFATMSAQLPRRSSVTANYTFSRTRDDDSMYGAYTSDQALDPLDPGADAGYANSDARHIFNISGVVNLPLGFKVDPVWVAHSGLPYTPVVGFDTQNDGNDWNDRALLNGSVAPRNSLRQPAFFDLDLRFVKDFTLPGEGHHLDLFMDIFNVTGASNRNFGTAAISMFGSPMQPVFSAGEALFAPDTTRFGSPRQVQFTARIVAF